MVSYVLCQYYKMMGSSGLKPSVISVTDEHWCVPGAPGGASGLAGAPGPILCLRVAGTATAAAPAGLPG